MDDHSQDLINDFEKKCRQGIAEFEKTQVRCGLIGPPGTGKSSLINAIAGERIAAVGVVETTSQPQEFVHRGIIFTDLPGCGTRNWPRDSYIEKLKLLTYDCFLLITAHRFTENDVFLYRELLARGKPCFVIRNMFDRAVDDARHDNKQSELETRQLITADIQKNLEPACPDRIYLTSARNPTRYDLKDLLNDISDALPGLKRTRFIADMASYGEEALKKNVKYPKAYFLGTPAYPQQTD